METYHDALKNFGFHLDGELFNDCASKSDAKIQSARNAIDFALQTDLKLVSGGSSASRGLSALKFQPALSSPLVVQLQRVVNVSVPKAKQEFSAASRLFRITLTDGSTTASAVEIAEVPGLSLTTPPGTKVKLSGSVHTVAGLLSLSPSNCQVIGGTVASLVHSWKLKRSAAAGGLDADDESQGVSLGRQSVLVEGKPPPWVPFGARGASQELKAAAKSVSKVVSLPKQQPGDEDGDNVFDEQRKQQIADAKAASDGTEVVTQFGCAHVDGSVAVGRAGVVAQPKITVDKEPKERKPDKKKGEKKVMERLLRDDPYDEGGGELGGRRGRGGRGGGGRGRRGRGRGRTSYDGDDGYSQDTKQRPTSVSLFDFLEEGSIVPRTSQEQASSSAASKPVRNEANLRPATASASSDRYKRAEWGDGGQSSRRFDSEFASRQPDPRVTDGGALRGRGRISRSGRGGGGNRGGGTFANSYGGYGGDPSADDDQYPQYRNRKQEAHDDFGGGIRNVANRGRGSYQNQTDAIRGKHDDGAGKGRRNEDNRRGYKSEMAQPKSLPPQDVRLQKDLMNQEELSSQFQQQQQSRNNQSTANSSQFSLQPGSRLATPFSVAPASNFSNNYPGVSAPQPGYAMMSMPAHGNQLGAMNAANAAVNVLHSNFGHLTFGAPPPRGLPPPFMANPPPGAFAQHPTFRPQR